VRVLLDECVPKALRRAVSSSGHACLTVQEAGWAGKKNGDLLDAAELAFDVLITIDTNLRFQQNLAGRKIALIVLVAPSNRLADLSPLFPRCVDEIGKARAGEVIYISGPE
jgi:predicted nuclease of predicted toxin-antitoxin system